MNTKKITLVVLVLTVSAVYKVVTKKIGPCSQELETIINKSVD